MSEMEDRIGRICVILALNPSMHDSLRKALHAFAAAISAKASEVQGEKSPQPCYHENHRYGRPIIKQDPCFDCQGKAAGRVQE